MAYLTKEQYDRRRENAEQRNGQNEKIALSNGMTECQAELISELCRLRHELHTNMNAVTLNDSNRGIKSQLVKLAQQIEQSGLPKVPSIPTGECDYIDIDEINELLEYDEWPEPDTQEWQNKYDDEYSRIYGELEQLNKDIEAYLADIDKRYSTHWCPTRTLRML